MTDNQINSKSIIAAEIKRAMDSSRITETQIKELQAAIEKLLLKGNP